MAAGHRAARGAGANEEFESFGIYYGVVVQA